MSNDNDCFQQYLGDLTTQARNANGQPAASAGPGTVSGQSSLGQRPTNASAEDLPSGAVQQSGEAEGQSTGPSGDSEAVASLHMKEGLQQDTGNSETKTAKVAAKLRSQDLQEKNRKAQRRFRERQKAKVSELEQKVAEQQRAMTVLLQDKANLESRVNIFVRVLQMRDEQIEQIRSGQRILAPKDKDEAAESFKDDLTLTVREAQPLVLTPSQVKNMTLDDMVSIWKEYVNELAQSLVDIDKSPQDVVAAEKIRRLCNEATILCMRVAISNPVVTKSFVACQLEDNCIVAGEEPPEMWLSVARSLQLSVEQRSELVQLRRLFISKLSSIIDQRKEIYALLSSSVPSAIGSRHTAIRYLQSHECIEKLKRNMREEHVLKLDWISTLFKHLLSPTQVARCIVQGWPYTPDTLAICSWVAAEDGDASALAVLTAPSRAPATSGAAAWATSSNQNGFPASNHNRGAMAASGSGQQNGDGHVNSMSKLPMSGSVPGSGDTQYSMGPANPSQHHSGSQAWALNVSV
ncbi:hypothetical protein ABBQ38_002227 [Trebouxia sp. C0009 RCD-2024]